MIPGNPNKVAPESVDGGGLEPGHIVLPGPSLKARREGVPAFCKLKLKVLDGPRKRKIIVMRSSL